jgi:hypothetical protein
MGINGLTLTVLCLVLVWCFWLSWAWWMIVVIVGGGEKKNRGKKGK